MHQVGKKRLSLLPVHVAGMELDCFPNKLVHVTRLGGEHFGAVEFDVTIQPRRTTKTHKNVSVSMSHCGSECMSQSVGCLVAWLSSWLGS